MDMWTVRPAEKEDHREIEAFINKSEAVYHKDCTFILVENEQDDIQGLAGIQIFGDSCLLRSFVCTPMFPARKLPVFLERLMLLAAEKGCDTLYLVTDRVSSVPFFEAFGFSLGEENSSQESVELSTALSELKRKKGALVMWKTVGL